MVRLRLWQIDCSDSELPAERVARVLEALPAAAMDTDFLLLPELWPTGAFSLDSVAEFREGNFLLDQLSAAAEAAGVWLHAGSIPLETSDDGRTYNTALLFNRAGELVGKYRKQHLFGWAEGERTVIAPGDELVVASTPLGRTGIATCYDLRFPELFRTLLDDGAQAFIIAAGWPSVRLEHWSVLVQARAIENQALTVACNARGISGGVELGGGSLVVDATGRVLAKAGVSEEFLDVEVDPGVTAVWRTQFPALDDRR